MRQISTGSSKLFAGTFFVAFLLLLIAGCSLAVSPVDDSSSRANSRAVTDSPPDIPRMTGVNWFGFESKNYIPHGLWARDYKSMLQQMKDLGFNTIRLPFCNEMLDKSPTTGLQINAWGNDPYTGVKGINVDLEGLTSIQIMDKIIDYAGSLGIRVVLDNHSREADGYYNQTLWYTAKVSEEKWISDWVMLAQRYKNKTNIVAYDLSNEPHGGYIVPGMSPAATWGFDLPGVAGSTNWKAAAERCAAAIMAVNSNIIFIIQGVQDYEGTNYWWGSNLRGLKVSPITSIPKNRLMYSVHEYGPEVHSQDWFEDPTFPANLPAVWRDAFYFVFEQKMAGLFIGEIGIKEESAANPASIPYKWFTSFLQFTGKKVHFTYWSWNPNSGDTGGILKDDWLTVNPVKYNLIKPYLEPIGGLPTPTPTASPTATPIATPTPTPNPTATPAPSETPYTGTRVAMPGLIEAENFDNGGEGIAYHDSDAINSGAAYRTTGVDIQACGEGGFNVGWTASGEYLKYMVSVATAGNYTVSARVAAITANRSIHIMVDDVNVTGSMVVPNTGDWQTFATVTSTAFSLSAGNHIVKLCFDTDAVNVNWLKTVSVGTPTPTPTPTATPVPTATPTPVPTATPVPVGKITLEYATTGSASLTSSIGMKLKIANTGAAVALKNLKVRYYYTSETAAQNSAVCDYAGGLIGSAHQAVTAQVACSIVMLSPVKMGADRYLEVSFAADSPSLAAGDSVEIQLRILNQQWSNFNQADDYSFLGTAQAYISNGKIVMIKDNAVISGTAP